MTVSLEYLPARSPRVSLIEREIIAQAVFDILLDGCAISVNDGEETVLTYSVNFVEIFTAMFSTEEDILIVTRTEGMRRKRLGIVRLIYGNGWDVISDSSDAVDPLLMMANQLAEQLQEHGDNAEQWLKDRPNHLLLMDDGLTPRKK